MKEVKETIEQTCRQYEQLKCWRRYSRAFGLEFFKGNAFWECLDTTKEG